jgi:SAM-dependent methyltransferase
MNDFTGAMKAILSDALDKAKANFKFDFSGFNTNNPSELCNAHKALVEKCSEQFGNSEIPPVIWDILTLAPQRQEWLIKAFSCIDWDSSPGAKKSVIDWGSGTGIIPRILKKTGIACDLTAIEKIPLWADYIKNEVNECDVLPIEIESFYTDQPVDILFSFMVHHHIEEMNPVLRKAFSLLGKDADFIIVDKIEETTFNDAQEIFSRWDIPPCDDERSTLPDSTPPHPIASMNWGETIRSIDDMLKELYSNRFVVIKASYFSPKIILLQAKRGPYLLSEGNDILQELKKKIRKIYFSFGDRRRIDDKKAEKEYDENIHNLLDNLAGSDSEPNIGRIAGPVVKPSAGIFLRDHLGVCYSYYLVAQKSEDTEDYNYRLLDGKSDIFLSPQSSEDFPAEFREIVPKITQQFAEKMASDQDEARDWNYAIYDRTEGGRLFRGSIEESEALWPESTDHPKEYWLLSVHDSRLSTGSKGNHPPLFVFLCIDKIKWRTHFPPEDDKHVVPLIRAFMEVAKQPLVEEEFYRPHIELEYKAGQEKSKLAFAHSMVDHLGFPIKVIGECIESRTIVSEERLDTARTYLSNAILKFNLWRGLNFIEQDSTPLDLAEALIKHQPIIEGKIASRIQTPYRKLDNRLSTKEDKELKIILCDEETNGKSEDGLDMWESELKDLFQSLVSKYAKNKDITSKWKTYITLMILTGFKQACYHAMIYNHYNRYLCFRELPYSEIFALEKILSIDVDDKFVVEIVNPIITPIEDDSRIEETSGNFKIEDTLDYVELKRYEEAVQRRLGNNWNGIEWIVENGMSVITLDFTQLIEQGGENE